MIESVQVANPVAEAPGAEPERKSKGIARLISLDAFRGMVMVLMLAELMRLPEVARAFPQSLLWRLIAFNTQHVEWQGCSLHDLIQPAFSFLVGAALPFSIASRKMKGQTFGPMLGHAVRRALLLVFLGIFLRSLRSPQTYFTFEDTLTQIGLGYVFLFLLGFARVRTQVVALVLILICFWAAFALYPPPSPNFDYARVGVSQNWNHNYTGFLSHWNKNSNLSWAFDVWFLNLFPREQPFVFNEGGWSTLSFIPTLGTMILGLIAGRWLRESRSGESRHFESQSLQPRPTVPVSKLLLLGVVGIALGLALHYSGICPVVKRIWTPSWTIFSGGICFLFLAAFSWVIEMKGFKKWAFPLVVVGMNSIVAYCIAHFMEEFLVSTFRIHLGPNFFQFAGAGLEPFFRGVAILLCYWLVLFWMYQRKLFLKI